MLNKPIMLTLLLIAISMSLGLAIGLFFALIGLKGNSGVASAASILAAYYVGMIYTSKFKVELPKPHKVKIVSYYFLIQMVLSIGLLFVILTALHLENVIGVLFAVAIVLNLIISLVMYPILGRGCRIKLKQFTNVDTMTTSLES